MRTVLAVAVFWSSAAFAQDRAAPVQLDEPRPTQKVYASRGVIRLGGEVSFSARSDNADFGGTRARSSGWNVGLGPEIGFFVADAVEISLSPGLAMSREKGRDSVSNSSDFTVEATGRYLFRTTNVYPFIGASVGWITGVTETETSSTPREDVSGEGVLVGGLAGIDAPLGGNSILSLGFGVARISMDVTGADGDAFDVRRTAFVGRSAFSVFF